MTDNDSDRWGELERLAREATPGPWRSGENMATDNRCFGGSFRDWSHAYAFGWRVRKVEIRPVPRG